MKKMVVTALAKIQRRAEIKANNMDTEKKDILANVKTVQDEVLLEETDGRFKDKIKAKRLKRDLPLSKMRERRRRKAALRQVFQG